MDTYLKCIDFIVNIIWNRWGPDNCHCEEAVDFLNKQVEFSSWVISKPDFVLIVEKSILSQFDVSHLSKNEQAILGMTHRIEQAVNKIQEDNKPVSWRIRFVKPNRFFTVDEIDGYPFDANINKNYFAGIPDDSKYPGEVPAIFAIPAYANEVAKEIAKEYLSAGLAIPEMVIVAFNEKNKEIPNPKVFEYVPN